MQHGLREFWQPMFIGICGYCGRSGYLHDPVRGDCHMKSDEPYVNAAPYGFCPVCGARGRMREQRLGGDDICEHGHRYPSRLAKYDGNVKMDVSGRNVDWVDVLAGRT